MFCVIAKREDFFLHTLVENLYCLFGDVLGSSLSTLSESISLSFSLSEVKKKNMNCCVCVCVVLRQHGYGKITLLSQFTRSQTHNEHTQKPLGGGSGNFTGMQVAFPRIVSVQGIPAPVSVNLKKPLLGVQQVLQLLQSRVAELDGLTTQTFRTLQPCEGPSALSHTADLDIDHSKVSLDVSMKRPHREEDSQQGNSTCKWIRMLMCVDMRVSHAVGEER